MVEGAADRAATSLLANSRSGRTSRGDSGFAALLDVQVERHLLRAMPPAPPPLAIPDLVHDDAEIEVLSAD